MNRFNRKPIGLVWGAALTLGLACSCSSDSPPPARAAEGAGAREGLPVVVVVNPEQADVEDNLTLAGSVEPFERAALFAKATGFLDKVHVDIGDAVKEGDVLAELTVPEMDPQMRQAEAEVVKAQANAKLAEVTHKRLADLRASEPGAVIEQDLDLAEAELGVARAEVRVAEAKVAGLWAMMAYATIRAPFDGIVTRRFFDTGALVVAGATSSEPIVEVVRTDKLRLVFDVPDVVSPFVAPGQKVSFSLGAFPGESFEGEVARCANSLMASTRTMRVEIDLESGDGTFRPGMYATVRLAYRSIPRALTIPATTLRIEEGEAGVLTVQNGAVRRVAVTILQDSGAEVVVRGEIGPETAVVLSGPRFLEEGQAVRVRRNGEQG